MPDNSAPRLSDRPRLPSSSRVRSVFLLQYSVPAGKVVARIPSVDEFSWASTCTEGV